MYWIAPLLKVHKLLKAEDRSVPDQSCVTMPLSESGTQRIWYSFCWKNSIKTMQGVDFIY